MRTWIALALALALFAGCAADEPGGPGEAPTPPGKSDWGWAVSGERQWYLIGDGLTPGQGRLEFEVRGPTQRPSPETFYVNIWIDGKHAQRMSPAFFASWQFSIDISGLPPGEHVVLVQADNARTAVYQFTFKRSYPLYVAVSNDWDTGDHGDDKLERQERLHANHPRLVMTHFVGPYTFTDPTVSPSRAQQLVQWLKSYQQSKGDEIGLHVHPHCHFITRAGIPCRSAPSFAYPSDSTGRTVMLGAYTRSELDKIFRTADELFVANGLGKPTSFRAGGWTATPDVLAALSDAGHVADASAVHWAKIEEWQPHSDAQLYAWLSQNWASIDETTQPYYPNIDDLLADTAPRLPILEVPDNGALADYVTSDEMIAMFNANYKPGKALTEPRQYSIGYHPVSFSEEYFSRIDGALTEIDDHLAADDNGPVIYARMSDLPKAFPPPP